MEGMKTWVRGSRVMAALVLAVGVAACDDDESGIVDAEPTVVDLAATSADLETLATAVGAADLAETLSGPGPFTVFAPTDAAFEALGEETRRWGRCWRRRTGRCWWSC